jgi:hypothetical protein
VRFQHTKICRPHVTGTRHALSRTSHKIDQVSLYLSGSSVRSSMVNALHPPENLGSPPKNNDWQLQHLPSSSLQIAAHRSLAAHSVACSYSTGTSPNRTFFARLLPQNICFPILDGTTQSLEFKLLASVPLLFPRENV